jgi:hypothetical protein
MSLEEWVESERAAITGFITYWNRMKERYPGIYTEVMGAGDWDEQFAIWGEIDAL